MKFYDIEKYPFIDYSIHVDWNDLISVLDRYQKNYNLQMNPDFQRGHVWTKEQQISYVEYMLKEPQSGGNIILFNHPNWMSNFKGEFVLIDGLQRLTASLKFLNNEIPAYGCLFKDYEDCMRNINFIFQISNLKTKQDVIKWYIQLNSGGTYHTKEEIERVKKMLNEER